MKLNYIDYYRVLPGSSVSLSVTAVAPHPPVTYQWYQVDEENEREEIPLEGETNAVLELLDVRKDGRYRCIAEDAAGNTAEAYIYVYADSGLTLEYDGVKRVKLGTDVTLKVEASSKMVDQEQITYQWSRQIEGEDYEEIPGETTNTLTLKNVQRTGQYRCKVSDSYMAKTVEFYAWIDTGLSAQAEQSKIVVEPGETVTVKVNASIDKGVLTYKWEKVNYEWDDWGRKYDILPETGNTATIHDVTANVRLRCTVSDEYGNSRIIYVSIIAVGETAPDMASAVELKVGDTKLASVAESEKKMYFKIVPETSETYVFSSMCGDGDPVGYLYDADGKELAYSYDSDEGFDFRISNYLEAGKTYYLAVGFSWYEEIGSFYVLMTREGETACIHEWEYINVTEPTCTAAGSRTPKCAKCGVTKAAETYGAALGHAAGAWKVTKKASCTAAGQKAQICSRCGKTMKTETIPAAGHKFSGWTVKSKATVFAAETQTRKCTVCGNVQNRTVGSKLKPTITVSATTIPLKTKQSTTKLKVTGLAAGDKVVSWKSSNTKIAAVNSKGKITAKNKTGKATITIKLASGLSKKVTVKVQKTAVKTTKISDLKKKVSLAKGKSLTLKPVIAPITSVEKVTYTSSNKKIATVTSKGVVKAKKAGTAKITVKSGTKKFVVTVTVPKTKTKAITGVRSSLSLKKGKTYNLKAKCSPANSDEKITYKSSNSKVAAVNASGKITAKKKGTATITIKSGKATVKCKVTVK